MLVKFLWGSSSDNFVLIIAIIKSNSFHLLDLSVFQSYRVFILICGPSSYNEISYFYTELLAHINPLLNPLVYVLCSKQYRVSVNELFTKCSCKGRCGFCGHTFYLKGKWKRDNLRFIKPASWLLHRSNISLVFPSNLSRSFNSLCTDVPPPSEKNLLSIFFWGSRDVCTQARVSSGSVIVIGNEVGAHAAALSKKIAAPRSRIIRAINQKLTRSLKRSLSMGGVKQWKLFKRRSSYKAL